MIQKKSNVIFLYLGFLCYILVFCNFCSKVAHLYRGPELPIEKVATISSTKHQKLCPKLKIDLNSVDFKDVGGIGFTSEWKVYILPGSHIVNISVNSGLGGIADAYTFTFDAKKGHEYTIICREIETFKSNTAVRGEVITTFFNLFLFDKTQNKTVVEIKDKYKL